jgi:hypothetical protein
MTASTATAPIAGIDWRAALITQPTGIAGAWVIVNYSNHADVVAGPMVHDDAFNQVIHWNATTTRDSWCIRRATAAEIATLS